MFDMNRHKDIRKAWKNHNMLFKANGRLIAGKSLDNETVIRLNDICRRLRIGLKRKVAKLGEDTVFKPKTTKEFYNDLTKEIRKSVVKRLRYPYHDCVSLKTVGSGVVFKANYNFRGACTVMFDTKVNMEWKKNVMEVIYNGKYDIDSNFIVSKINSIERINDYLEIMEVDGYRVGYFEDWKKESLWCYRVTHPNLMVVGYRKNKQTTVDAGLNRLHTMIDKKLKVR